MKGMRKTNQEITDQSIIDQILSDSEICWIAMNDEKTPYVLPFNYGYRDGCLYIHSAQNGKKIDLLQKQPEVGFAIKYKGDVVKDDIACKWATYYRSVAGTGKVELLNKAADKEAGLEIIMQHNGAIAASTFTQKHVEGVVILKLTIDTITGKQSGNWDRFFEASQHRMETDRLVLNEISWDDLEDIHELHSFPEVDEFNTLGLPETLEETRQIIKISIEAQNHLRRSAYEWKIVLKESKQIIGLCGYLLSDDKYRSGEIYYKLNPKYWNMGYATEVARKLVKYGFETFKLHRVEAGVAVNNFRSLKVLEKVGMQHEGIRRKILPIRGEWVDNYHYAIVEDDFRFV